MLSSLYGQPAEAISILQTLVAVYQKMPRDEHTLRKMALDWFFLGIAYTRAGRYDDALQSLRNAEAIAQQSRAPELLWVYLQIGGA
jgi:tetratricopeptide (TPR) repeat protein